MNASPDRYLDLQLDGKTLEVVALDGMPLAYRDPKHSTKTIDHLLVAPAGRLEAIVTGPPSGVHGTLRTRCVDTGPVGDPNPEMVLADVVQPGSDPADVSSASRQPHAIDGQPPIYKPVDVEALKKTAPDFVVNFTEDKNGFYINGQKYSTDASPMTSARVGTYQHWRIVNETAELHPFHIHQVHFLGLCPERRASPHASVAGHG